MFDLLPRWLGGASGREMSVLLLLVSPSFLGCQAPRPVIEADDLATQIEDEYQGAVQARLGQWRRELAHSWEKELGYILQMEMAAKADANGSIPVADVLSLLALQKEARGKNVQRLGLEGEADQAATAGWRESRKIREAIRRWLQAGMSEEDRDKIYQIVIGVAHDRSQ